MNKKDLVVATATKTGLSQKDVGIVLEAILDTIGQALEDSQKVTLVGFGAFESKQRAARQGKNPKTGEIVDIPPAKLPVFKAGKALKDRVNK